MTSLRKAVFGLVGLVGLAFATPAFAVEFDCTPAHVAVYQSRIHVKCTTSVNDGGSTIWYYAVKADPSSDQGYANRVLSTLTTALVSARKVTVYFTAGDTSGNAWGCGSSNCRSVYEVDLK